MPHTYVLYIRILNKCFIFHVSYLEMNLNIFKIVFGKKSLATKSNKYKIIGTDHISKINSTEKSIHSMRTPLS